MIDSGKRRFDNRHTGTGDEGEPPRGPIKSRVKVLQAAGEAENGARDGSKSDRCFPTNEMVRGGGKGQFHFDVAHRNSVARRIEKSRGRCGEQVESELCGVLNPEQNIVCARIDQSFEIRTLASGRVGKADPNGRSRAISNPTEWDNPLLDGDELKWKDHREV